MATSDSSLATVMVDVLNASGVDYAVLHGAQRVRSGSVVSDLDVVVAEEPKRLLVGVQSDLVERDLHLVMDWRYDVGGTRTTFFVRGDASDGIQLDLLFDPAGRGRYGVRSDRLLARRRLVDGIQVLDERDELIYLLAKRLMKNDRAQVELLVRTAADQEILERVPEVLVPAMASVVESAILGDGAAAPRRAGRWVRGWVRRLERLYRPAGFWIDVPDPSLARELRARFSRFIPHVPSEAVSGVSARITRLRPAVVITSAARSHAPDGTLTAESVEDAARQLVHLMQARTIERLST